MELIKRFYEEMRNVNTNALGIIDGSGLIHTLGTDSKLIGRIFEMFTQPVLEKIANERGMTLGTPTQQNVYPDFILSAHGQLIAVDVKTTYVNNDVSPIKFTLGSYCSYLRDNTKNIVFPYNLFTRHYVIGFVYKRSTISAQNSTVYRYDQANSIPIPYYDVKYFMQEKYKIVGEKPGSGNTENIGSISTKNFSDFLYGKGPFSELGHDICDLYWCNYPPYRDKEKMYVDLPGFINLFLSGYSFNLPPYEINIQSVHERLECFKQKYHI